MAPIKIDQGTVIILDIGRNTSATSEKEDKCFFVYARECAARILERKILSQAKNYVGVILLGSKSYTGDFKHIEIIFELQTPTWQMIRNLPENASKTKGNWFDALIVAVDHFKNGVPGVKFMNRKIILMTNFKNPSLIEDDQMNKALFGLKEEEFEVDIIGPNIYSEDNKYIDIEYARNLVEGTNGATATFEYTMRYLLYHRKKATNPIPWNVDLSIGPNIKIPLSVYIKLKDEPVVKNWLKCVKDPITNTASTTEGILKNKIYINSENKSVIDDSSNVIKGYSYGQQIIPFSDCDKSMLYEPGQKSLNVYGFTAANNVTWQCLNGDGLFYVFGQKGDKKAQFAVKCLAECLHELNLIGIVRRVYNNGNAPKMFALMPIIDANYVCLSMAEICYKENLKNITFPVTNIKKFSINDEQVLAFKNLIKSMDLTKAYEESEFDDTEAFPIGETVSPSAQYVLDCIAYRAMNPGKPLPSVRDDINMLSQIPPLIKKRSREPLEKIKKLFDLKKVEPKTKKKSLPMDEDDQQNIDNNNDIMDIDEMPKININHLDKSIHDIKKVGTIDPLGDFNILIRHGKPFIELAKEMTQAIESIIYTNFDNNYDKAFEAMAHFRDKCVELDPTEYNSWLRNFKMELNLRKNDIVLNLITNKKVGYILKNENEESMYEKDDAESELYENDTVPELTEVSISSQVNNMFDDI
ncbi:X-ray repair cross-complementing protein 5-like [Leptidea sinapis]|uniref:X-ray repair cross-complementing protein 5-like n=1 Tax=Leptidea sinapis TaxID=189913 RepID=UPI00213421BD|nr:X-ray repair cross-complementing protein 5-like [Leptidea sinapis]XP_050665732.1 X-ray repair cross-complementing protein 5-like [Leptidea sinapis]